MGKYIRLYYYVNTDHGIHVGYIRWSSQYRSIHYISIIITRYAFECDVSTILASVWATVLAYILTANMHYVMSIRVYLCMEIDVSVLFVIHLSIPILHYYTYLTHIKLAFYIAYSAACKDKQARIHQLPHSANTHK